jgi:hypothetical protein
MSPLGMLTMTQILKFDDPRRNGQSRLRSQRSAARPAGLVPALSRTSEKRWDEETMHEFWPEVSCRLGSEQLPNPENAQGRVLTELFAILAAAGAAVLAVTLFVPNPPFS